MDELNVDVREEAALVRRARWGSQQAFAILYDRHAGAIHALAYRLTGDSNAADDIVQESFLRLVQFISGLRGDRPLRPWLKKVAANAAIDRLRKHRATRSISPFEDIEGESEELSVDLAYELELRLRRLPPHIRTVVWLHAVEGWTHAELAARFARTESWSKSVVARAMQDLKSDADIPGVSAR